MSSELHISMDNSVSQIEPSIGGVVGNDLINIDCSAIDSQNQSSEALGREEKGGGEDDGVEEELESSTPACMGITPVNLAMAATAVHGKVERDAEATKASGTSRLVSFPQGSYTRSPGSVGCKNQRVMTAPPVPENTLNIQASMAESCGSSQIAAAHHWGSVHQAHQI